MKQLIINTIFFSVLLGCSSNVKTKASIEPLAQIKFDSLHKIASEKKYSANNDIQKKEYSKQFDEQLNLFLDSNCVFVNWKGKMSDISVKEMDKFSIIKSEINCDYEDFREITFTSEYIVNTKNLKNDSIYAMLKRIPIGSTVYFDGFIIRDIDNKIKYYDTYSLSKENKPNYGFNILQISSIPHNDYLSENLNKMIPIHFKIFDLLKQKVNKEITNKQWEKETKYLAPKVKEDNLNLFEKEYLIRVKQYLYDDFMK